MYECLSVRTHTYKHLYFCVYIHEQMKLSVYMYIYQRHIYQRQGFHIPDLLIMVLLFFQLQ